jgi:hypothetical protein
MARLEKVKIEKVWADEIFYASNTATVDVTAPPGVLFTADSTITGDATFAVVNCQLTENLGVITANVEYMVQEELTVQVDAAPGPDDFDLEYAFRFEETYEFQKAILPVDVDIENLRCQVFRLSGTVALENVDLPEGESEGSFDNVVSLMTKLKLSEEIQTFVALGAAPNVQTVEVTVN